jgi:hypothetical protein
MAQVRAGRTCSARQPAGRATNKTDRLVRSTSVSTAEGRLPSTRSPSQGPGTDRPLTSVGRWLIETVLVSWPLPWQALAGRVANRPTSAQATPQLTTQDPTAPEVQAQVDGLMRDPHGWVIGEATRSQPATCSVTSATSAWPPPRRGAAAPPPACTAWVGPLAGRQPHQLAGLDIGGGRRCRPAPATETTTVSATATPPSHPSGTAVLRRLPVERRASDEAVLADAAPVAVEVQGRRHCSRVTLSQIPDRQAAIPPDGACLAALFPGAVVGVAGPSAGSRRRRVRANPGGHLGSGSEAEPGEDLLHVRLGPCVGR